MMSIDNDGTNAVMVETTTSMAMSSAGQQQQQRRRTRCEPQSQHPTTTTTDDTDNNDNKNIIEQPRNHSMNSSCAVVAEASSLLTNTTSKRQRIKSPITTTTTKNTTNDADDNYDDDENIVIPLGGFAAELATRVFSNNNVMMGTTHSSSSSALPRQQPPNEVKTHNSVTTSFRTVALPQSKLSSPLVRGEEEEQRHHVVPPRINITEPFISSSSTGNDDVHNGTTITPPQTTNDVEEHDDDTSKEEMTSIGSSSSSSSTNDGSSSDEDSEEESEFAPLLDDVHVTTTTTITTTSIISRRQKQLSKLLRGIEGSAYANAFIRWEEMVNANLSLLEVKVETNNSHPNTMGEEVIDFTTSPSSSLEASNPRFDNADSSSILRHHRWMVRDVIFDEYYHTLPASFSLLLHCTLYIVLYSLIANIVDTLKFENNNVDMYYFTIMLVSLCMSRMTGNVYNWNDNTIYQKRIDFQLRNKWYLKLWDVKLRNFLEGDAIRSRYEKNTSSLCEGQRRKIWGRRIKVVLDCCSFFLCYKSVEHFIGRVVPVPSSLLPSMQGGGGGESSSSVVHQRHDVSHACPSVMSALDNPYTLDILNSVSKLEVQTEEMKGWITNAKNCGWSDASSGKKKINDLHVGDKVEGNWHMEGVYYPGIIVEITNDDYSVIVRYDDNGSFETLSTDNVRRVSDKYAKFVDQVKEPMFLVTVTVTCLGLLYAYDIPFLLI
jgi:hypothetical protein